MNRHGISQNPTQEESARLRELWAADDARHRAHQIEGGLAFWRRRALEAEARLRSLDAPGSGEAGQ